MTNDDELAARVAADRIARPAQYRSVCDDHRPAEGWSEPDKDGHVRFTMYDRIDADAPAREGFEAYFVAVHGVSFTTWTYRPIEEV